MYVVSPACAGMIPIRELQADRDASEPRMRGDDPAWKGVTMDNGT